MLSEQPEKLETERLVLEPLEVAHAAEMAPVLDDERLHRYTGGAPLDLAGLQELYARQVRGRSADGRQRWFNWIVRERRSGAAAGYVQATVDAASGAAELAWVVGSRYQGRGYAREAAAAMLNWLRDEGIGRVTAHIRTDHAASEAVAHAIGLVPTPAVRDGETRWEFGRSG